MSIIFHFNLKQKFRIEQRYPTNLRKKYRSCLRYINYELVRGGGKRKTLTCEKYQA